DAGRPVAAKPLGLDGGGVGLQRHLYAGRHCPVACNGLQYGAHGLRLHQRRRAVADEDRRHLSRAAALAHRCKFPRKGAGETFLVDRLMAHMAVEVAIRALGRAEGPMNVDPESWGTVELHVHGPGCPLHEETDAALVFIRKGARMEASARTSMITRTSAGLPQTSGRRVPGARALPDRRASSHAFLRPSFHRTSCRNRPAGIRDRSRSRDCRVAATPAFPPPRRDNI